MSQKHSKKKIEKIAKKFVQNNDFSLETNIPNFGSFLSSDIMITDWSGSALEFSFAFEKPVIFIDVPKKINNPEFEKISFTPIEISIREKIGKIIMPKDLDSLPKEIQLLISRRNEFEHQIVQIRNKMIFNIKESKKHGAEAIIGLLNDKSIS